MELLEMLGWIGDFIAGMIRLTVCLFLIPFLIILWCLYHRREAWIYISNAIPLLLSIGWPCWIVLGFFTVLIASLFKKHAIFKVLWLAIGIGFVGYVALIFIDAAK